MAIRKVARMGHPVLRTVAAAVPEATIRTPAISGLIHDMIETMFEYEGRGLAAPQVYESVRIVVMLWNLKKGDDNSSILCLINPVITLLTEETSTYWEGCLSLPGLRGKVTRPNRLSLAALGPKGEKIQMNIDGFEATVVQHECDHLDGKLYVDRIKDMKDFAFTSEYERYCLPDDPASEAVDE